MRLTIEKLVYGGDGLARAEPDPSGRRQTVFIPFVLEGEQVEATIAERRRDFLRARLQQVCEPAAQRVEPACPYFYECGGCHYQHASYEEQLAIKQKILRESLSRAGGIDWQDQITVHAAEPWHYRNRTRLQVLAGDGSFSLAYFRLGTRELLPIEQCPISSPLINRAISALNAMGRAGSVLDGVREIEIFADAGDTRLMLEIYFSVQPVKRTAQRFYEEARSSVPEISSVATFTLMPGRSTGIELRPDEIAGEPALAYKIGEFEYRVSPGAFFQVNRHLVEKLIALVVPQNGGHSALDLFAGVGLFSLPLARRFAQVIAVEGSRASSRDLANNVPANVSPVHANVEKFLKTVKTTDCVVADPPRVGLGPRICGELVRIAAPRLTYVSCDPATLARDLKILVASGYRMEQLHLVDMFPQTFHVESVAELALK
jgi:23S rRNA (uracil1939-C5)-methyltransferase